MTFISKYKVFVVVFVLLSVTLLAYGQRNICQKCKAIASLKSGDRKRAIDAYMNALKADKGNKEYIYHLKRLKVKISPDLKRK